MSVDVVSFGCRLNSVEAETMRLQAQQAGLDDVIIINSCAVTAEATRQVRQTIRRLKRDDPSRRIIVTGCAAQTEPDRFAAMPEVARVVGNDLKDQPESWTAARSALDFGIGDEERVVVGDIMAVRETASHLTDGFIEGRVRAFVQIQNGCDHRCTFCIIPFGRGNSRSVPMGEVIRSIQALCARGIQEVVLTGVDLTSYGTGLPGSPSLGTLVKAILRHCTELPRLRLSSIDSIEVDADLLDVLAHEQRFMPHLHLSVQAGDDMILKRMKRRHLRADTVEFCRIARSLRPDVVFGADLIAGFPTETDEMHRNSLALVDDCGLTFLHVFPFSPRSGTPAARMPLIPRDVVRERARALRSRGEMALRRHLEARVGRREQVLVESPMMGRTCDYTQVRLASALPSGSLHDVTIAAHDSRTLISA